MMIECDLYRHLSSLAEEDMEWPIYEYYATPDNRASVIGGYTYRGSQYPDLDGLFFFADFVRE
jgi:hypothetical protein